MRTEFKRVGVLMGGPSAEREVSLETGQGVLAALRSLGYDCVELDWTDQASVCELVSRVDVVWNALHGTFGEDGAIQGLLSCLRVPYTGSGILASALAMDKVASKRIFEARGVPTPPWRVLQDDTNPDDIALPAVIKPAQEGSSVGVSIVQAREQVAPAIAQARNFHGATLIEEFIPGAEVQTGILDGEVLGSIEIRPAVEFYDYEAKYQRDDTQYLIPTTLTPDVLTRAEKVALEAYFALGCAGHSRIDLRVRGDGEVFCLEVNTLPGMTGHSLLPKIAAHRGMDYAELCDRILSSASRSRRLWL